MPLLFYKIKMEMFRKNTPPTELNNIFSNALVTKTIKTIAFEINILL